MHDQAQGQVHDHGAVQVQALAVCRVPDPVVQSQTLDRQAPGQQA